MVNRTLKMVIDASVNLVISHFDCEGESLVLIVPLRGFGSGPHKPGCTSHRRRGLKFRILVVEGLYYPYSENKGADQLRSYCAADLPL